jgi:HNH endonuclease
MVQTELERRFEREMRDGLPELKRLGYNPTYFIRMMNDMGAARAVRALIDSPGESEGFTRLWEMGHLELSAEAVVADQPEWAELFDDDQRQKARRRLEQVGYKFKNQPYEARLQPGEKATAETLPTGDGPLRAMAEVTLRPYQTQFREALRRRYGDACQITCCSVMAVVQACHLVPVSAKGTDESENGLLLKVDLHVLFDANLIAIHPDTLTVHIAPGLAQTEYAQYQGCALRVGQAPPNRAALSERWAKFTTQHR